MESALHNLEAIQESMSREGYTDDLLAQEQNAQAERNTALHSQELFWMEKARVDWHTCGDRNTAYLAKVRHASKRISLLKNCDVLLENQNDIEAHILKYYEDLFSSDNACIDDGLIEEVVGPVVTEADNRRLISLPTWDEVKNVVFDMNPNGAPGPDGFGGFFFQYYWDIVGTYVFNSITHFLSKAGFSPI